MPESTTILCIEDEATLLEDLAEELHDAGYTVVTANNGREGLEAATTHHPDLIVSDIMMPEMEGTDVLEALRRMPGAVSDTPFIFLTAKVARDAVVAGKRLGADDYLTKPVDFDLLLATIEARLGQVNRIKKRSEKEMIKLYESMSGKAPARAGALRVGLVAGNLHAVLAIQDGLAAIGCMVRCISAETELIDHAKRGKLDLLFVLADGEFERTSADDLRERAGQPELPLFRLLPQRMVKTDPGALPKNGYDQTIAYPYKPAEVFKAIISTFENLRRPAEKVAV